MVLKTKEKITIQRQVIGTEQVRIWFEVSPIVIVNENNVINVSFYKEFDELTKREFLRRGVSSQDTHFKILTESFVLSKEETIQVVHDYKNLKKIITESLIEFMNNESLKSEDDFEEELELINKRKR